MLKELTIFEAAANYDFSAIRAYVEGGSSLNICNDKGHSLLACFIDGYYDHEDEDPEELALYDIHDESDYDFWDLYFGKRPFITGRRFLGWCNYGGRTDPSCQCIWLQKNTKVF